MALAKTFKKLAELKLYFTILGTKNVDFTISTWTRGQYLARSNATTVFTCTVYDYPITFLNMKHRISKSILSSLVTG